MIFFKDVAMAPPDAVLSLNVLFKNDPRKEKVNLGVGAYKCENLLPWPLPSVKKAEEIVLKTYLDKEYLPIDGDCEYNEETAKLIFGHDFDRKRLFGTQAIGGTGALRIGADFLFRYGPKKIYISDPTWQNHKQIFGFAGLEVKSYPHCNIEHVEEGSVIVFQPCCHNPTGIDPNETQWKALLETMKRKRLLPFFDFAYQGFARGIEEDAFAIRECAKHFDEFIVSYSYSKNFGLYGERVGALFFVCPNDEERNKIASQLKVLIRANYSSPPSHGARIVKTVLRNPELKAIWEQDVTHMRTRLSEMRQLLVKKFEEKKAPRDFAHLLSQHGMFSFIGLTKEQVDVLIHKFGIYLTSNGRISVAGLSKNNLDWVVDAIISVM